MSGDSGTGNSRHRSGDSSGNGNDGGGKEMINSITVEAISNQVIDMADWDFSESETIKKAIRIVENRQARAIILSTATGVTKFNREQCDSVDLHRLMRAPLSRVNKAIKCSREQDNRGLYFALEIILGRGDERDAAIQTLRNQKGMLESNEHWAMYSEGEYGWRIIGAKVVTNSAAVRDSVNRTIAGRCWIKSSDNKRI